MFLTMVHLLYLLYLTTLRLSFASDKAKLFNHNCSNLDDPGISLSVLPARTNLKLVQSFCISQIVKKVKNCEHGILYILVGFFNMCLKKHCPPDCWKILSVVTVFKSIKEKSTAKNYRPISLLSVVSNVFEKLVTIGLLIT